MNILRMEIERQDVTFEDLAVSADLSVNQLLNRLDGNTEFSLSEATSIARRLNGMVSWLFYGEIPFSGLKYAMQEKDLDVHQVAQASGVPVRKLQGFGELEFDELIAIAKVFPGYSVDYLFFYETSELKYHE